ncbi:hypothetical protein GCM10023162_36990 [Klenkia terrae]
MVADEDRAEDPQGPRTDTPLGITPVALHGTPVITGAQADAQSDETSLAYTGSDLGTPLLAGLLALAMGLILSLTARRTR